jgi:hypothetical protein
MVFQIELTLNLLHPFEYDPRISAHEGLFGSRFDFSRHPVAPVGAKVLVWNSPDNRGSWSDHGVPGICGGTNVTGNFCERKYSRHSNEVSLSTMRLGTLALL